MKWNAAVSTRKDGEKERLKSVQVQRTATRTITEYLARRDDGTGRRKTLRQFGGDPTCQRPKGKLCVCVCVHKAHVGDRPTRESFSFNAKRFQPWFATTLREMDNQTILLVYLLPYSRCFLTANLPRYVARQRPEAENWRPVCPTLFTKGRGRTQQFHPRGKSARQRSPRRYARRTAVDRHNSRSCIILPIGFPYVIAISVQRPCEINFLRPRVWQREAR